MPLLDTEAARARALVIDGDARSRQKLASTLKSFGIGQVQTLGSAADARRVLALVQMDIIVCESSFPEEGTSGQELIDELRLEQRLPLSTVVVMLSDDATYGQVAEAAEAGLDAYVIKPYTQEALREKLAQARERKRVLQPVFDKIAEKAYAEAAQLCKQVYERRGDGWVQAARIGAELMLKLGNPQAAMDMQEAVLSTKALPWAKVGIARADLPPGQATQGRRTLESLLAEQPGHSDAYDMMCRSLLEQGDVTSALAVMRRASNLTPDNVPRLQKLGVLAFYYGDLDEAVSALGRATEVGMNSRSYDLQGLLLQATLHFDRRESKELAHLHTTFGRVLSSVQGSARLNRFDLVFQVLRLLDKGRTGDAMQMVEEMLKAVTQPQFDFEAACNALMLVSRLAREDNVLTGIDEQAVSLAKRFAVSKASCELLANAGRRDEHVAGLIRDGYAAIGKLAEEGVSLSLAGKPEAAVGTLLGAAETTFNGRLLDLAEHTLARYHSAIRETRPLKARIEALRASHHSYGAQLRNARPQ
jgi:CheY-like chemotaxis protein